MKLFPVVFITSSLKNAIDESNIITIYHYANEKNISIKTYCVTEKGIVNPQGDLISVTDFIAKVKEEFKTMKLVIDTNHFSDKLLIECYQHLKFIQYSWLKKFPTNFQSDDFQDLYSDIYQNYLNELKFLWQNIPLFHQDISINVLFQIISFPTKTGIYKFFNRENKIIYIGKAKNIKSRVLSHFKNYNRHTKTQTMIGDAHQLDYELTGNETMALLRECELIQKHWPKYNLSLKRYEHKFILVNYKDRNGFEHLAILKKNKNTRFLVQFSQISEANAYLIKLIDQYQLERNFCHFYEENLQTYRMILSNTDRFTINPLVYNRKIILLIADIKSKANQIQIFEDKGRNDDEKSIVVWKNNALYAKGFAPIDINENALLDAIESEMLCRSNFYLEKIIKVKLIDKS